MRRVRYVVAMSLDGYIAGPNGEADWIIMDPEIDFGALFDEFDTVLMGRRTFEVPFVLTGSEWQKAVWRALTQIPFGETRSYAEVAEMVGRPKAARAVGKANATNRLPVVVPCHRVIGADGSLTGFAGGLHLKTRLLEHEARVLAGASPLPRGISTPA